MQEGQRSIAGLRRHVDRFASCGVLVVGDVMLDEYISGPVDRISPEAPVAVIHVRETDHRLGGAANVTHNVRTLGAKARLAGVVGDDGYGRLLRDRIRAQGVDGGAVVVDPGRPTSVKTRVIAQKQQIVRYDRESRAPLSDEARAALLQNVRTVLPRAQALVLSDYAKGCLSPELIGELIAMGRAAKRPVLVDPKIKNFAAYRGATLITPNYKEACEAASLVAGIHVEAAKDLERAAERLLATLEIESLVVTKGEEGMFVFVPGKAPLHIPTAAREVFDVSGAGDTVVATLAVALAVGAPLPEAAMLANHAAGIVVGKFGTAAVTAEELKAALPADEVTETRSSRRRAR